MVNVTNGANVYVGLRPLELLLCHVWLTPPAPSWLEGPSGLEGLALFGPPARMMFVAASVPAGRSGPRRRAKAISLLEPTIGFEPMTSPLPRVCSANWAMWADRPRFAPQPSAGAAQRSTIV